VKGHKNVLSRTWQTWETDHLSLGENTICHLVKGLGIHGKRRPVTW
jgi:hypothetical protein